VLTVDLVSQEGRWISVNIQLWNHELWKNLLNPRNQRTAWITLQPNLTTRQPIQRRQDQNNRLLTLQRRICFPKKQRLKNPPKVAKRNLHIRLMLRRHHKLRQHVTALLLVPSKQILLPKRPQLNKLSITRHL